MTEVPQEPVEPSVDEGPGVPEEGVPDDSIPEGASLEGVPEEELGDMHGGEEDATP